MATNCPGCGSRSCKVFYESRKVPTNNDLLASSRAEAVAVRRGDVTLNFCSSCGFVFNSAFDPGPRAVVSSKGNTGHVSSFDMLRHLLANRLVDRHALHSSHIPQTSWRGDEVLTFVCRLTDDRRIDDRRCVPTDPPALLSDGRMTAGVGSIREVGAADRVDPTYSTMALMHLQDPVRFLALLRRLLAGRRETRVVFQVSNFVRTLTHIAFWDIQYQHCSYFSPGTLQRLLRARGFEVNEVWSDRDGQHLMADTAAEDMKELRPYEAAETVADLAGFVARFEHECREKQAMWCETLHRIVGAGNRIAIWGAGSSTAAFLTTLAIGNEVSYVVDPDPSRQGKYMPGTGHRIVTPDAMPAKRPDVVIVMDAALTFEIQDLLAEAGCAPTLLIA